MHNTFFGERLHLPGLFHVKAPQPLRKSTITLTKQLKQESKKRMYWEDAVAATEAGLLPQASLKFAQLGSICAGDAATSARRPATAAVMFANPSSGPEFHL